MVSTIYIHGTILILFLLAIFYHLGVLMGKIPMEMAWGGRMKNRPQLVRFEIFSLGMIILMAILVMIHAGWIFVSMSGPWLQVAMRAMSILFGINMLGNLYAKHPMEKWGMGLITLVLAVLCGWAGWGY